ncbi:MAG TPA: hypothetical protein VM674_01750 [Candidatus Acidoferrum sp.]|nr:hypothetical protein [Candidatus Acidoferrum sp.]
MKRRVFFSVLASIGILVGGFGLAYAVGTFNATQKGFRQGGEGQAARLTMQVEAGTADANSDFVPDDSTCNGGPGNDHCAGGALNFAITNTSDLPIRVTSIALANTCGGLGVGPCIGSNKNGDGTYPPAAAFPTGDCASHVTLAPPANFNKWPTIGPNSTLQVNGTDNNSLGAAMVHLDNATPQGCQGALFSVGLNITATEQAQPPGFGQLFFNP